MELEESRHVPTKESVHSTTVTHFVSQRADALKYMLAGAFLGLSWAAGLRAWMVLLALEFGDRPRFTWINTFVVILLSATIMGGILGGAQYARQTGGSQRWRWAALAPLTLVIFPLFFMPTFIPTLLSTGEGGGAISVALAGIFGGHALAGGRRWLRLVSGLLFISAVLGTAFALHLSPILNGLSPTASQTFGALFFTQLMLLLAFGASIPYRHQAQPSTGVKE